MMPRTQTRPSPSRAWITAIAWIAIGAAALPAAGASIDAVRISIVHDRVAGSDHGWGFHLEVDGSALDAGVAPSLTIPGPVALPFTEVAETFLHFFDTGFPTVQALLDTYAVGDYLVEADDASVSVALAAPVPPVLDGASAILNVVFPDATHATPEIPSRSPTFVVEYACSNCDFMQAALTRNGSPEASPLKATAPDPFPCSYPLSAFGLEALADDDRTIAVSVGTESAADVSGVAYLQQTARRHTVPFTVADGGGFPEVEDLTISYRRSYEAGELSFLDWNFFAELSGSNIADASIYPPCRDASEFFDEGQGELVALGGAFSSLEDLQQVYPPTNAATHYVLMVDGGSQTASVEFDPESIAGGPPDGHVVIAKPEFGATVDGSRVRFELDNSCTNCTSSLLEVLDLDPDPPFLIGSNVDVASFDDTSPLPALIRADYPEDFGDNDSGPNYESLPEGDYLVDADVAITTLVTGQPLVPSGSFALESGFFMTDVIEFTAPEPGGGMLQLVALGVVAAWVRRRPPQPSSAR